ncbi:DUF2807 domain-containing protein, partial [bacterium]|nr:DUF2807 domain-containing protein [bacterium]
SMKKIHSSLLIILMLMVSIGVSQAALDSGVGGNGKIKSEVRDLSVFTGVMVEGSMDVDIVQGSKQSVTISAEENLLELITTEIDDGILIIFSKKSYRSRRGIKIQISMEKIDTAVVKGSGDINIAGGFKGETLILTVKGSGDINLFDCQTGVLDCYVMGSGDVRITGKTETANLSLKGSGDIHAMELTGQTVNAEVLGSGDIRTHAVKILVATVKGSGDIAYSGNPEVTSSVLGSGDITKK